MNFAKDLVETLKDEFTNIAADEKGAAEFSGFIDTGCYMLNAILSGSLYGGVPNNKIVALAGASATGKTFFALSVVKHFLDSNPENLVVYYDTEAAVTKQMMESRGIDTTRVIISEVATMQQFRTHAIRVLKAYEAKDEAERPEMMIVLDSLGMLSTSKEMEDSEAGKETRDMTRAQLVRAAFRVLTLHLAKVRVPLILTNHIYDVVGAYVPTKEMGGGSGLKYAASTVLFLSKKQDKAVTKSKDNDILGNIIKVKTYKSRIARENAEAELLLTYEKGLDKYFGLLQLAEKHGIIKKVSTQYELPDGRKVYGKHIHENPKEIFTEEIMEQLEGAAQKEFLYGVSE